jgi:hypothetical protein
VNALNVPGLTVRFKTSDDRYFVFESFGQRIGRAVYFSQSQSFLAGLSFAQRNAQRNYTEIETLRKALEVADKALEHYGDPAEWYCSTHGNQTCEECARELWLGKGWNGYHFAQQARTEIQNILKQ